MTTIPVTQETYKTIKRLYDKAIRDGKTEFIFGGHVLLVSYAKYLLEYMQSILKPK